MPERITQIICDPRFFPTILIVLDVCAAIAYGYAGNWRRAVYWMAAAILTTTVTW